MKLDPEKIRQLDKMSARPGGDSERELKLRCGTCDLQFETLAGKMRHRREGCEGGGSAR